MSTTFQDRNMKLLPGSDDFSATVCIDDARAEVRVVFTRTEPDAADDERRHACSYEVQAVDRESGKVLAFTTSDDYFVSGGLSAHAVAVVANGDFDEQIGTTLKLAGLVPNSSANDMVTFHVWHDGDRSVGIDGDKATVTVDAGGFHAREDRAEFLANARAELARAFSSIWDTSAKVATEQELGAGENAGWEEGRVASSLAQGKELAAIALRRAGLPAPQWRPSVGSISPWEYADIDVGGYKPLSVGASAGGVISIDGDSHTPGDRKVNVRLDRVEKSLAAGISKVAEVSKSVGAVHSGLDRVIDEADKLLMQAGLPSYRTLIGLVSEAKPHVQSAVEKCQEQNLHNAYAYNMDKLGGMQKAIMQFREAEVQHGMSADVQGYVLAFPGASDAEAEELIETLKGGGNTVFRVDGPAASIALRESVAQAGLDADDFHP